MGPWQFVTLNSGLIHLSHMDKADDRSKKDYTGRERETQTDCPISHIKTVVETGQI